MYVYQCTQPGEQTGGAGAPCLVRKLYHRNNWNMVGQLMWLEDQGGYRLFSKDMQGRRVGGVPLCVKENTDFIEASYGDCGSPTKYHWFKIRGLGGKGYLTEGVYYQPPNQDNNVQLYLGHLSKFQFNRTWFLWVTSTTQMFVGRTI